MTDTEDFNSLRAHIKIDAHEKVCAERYKQIVDKLLSLENQFQTVHGRFNTISNRMWASVSAVCGMAILGLAVMVVRSLK